MKTLPLFALLLVLVASPLSVAQDHWANWRGPLLSGVAPLADPPVQWSEEKNVRWKVPIPGEGVSTPIVWEDRIYLTAAIPYGKPFKALPDTAEGAHDNRGVTTRFEFVVLCIDRNTGKTRWTTTVTKTRPKEGGHFTGSLASNSPVTDGELIYAFFGSRGLYALDRDGKIVWQKDLGQMETRHAHGEGASPALHDDTLVVNWDHEQQSYLYAFDKKTGKQRWRVERDEMTSWSTPIVVDVEDKPQVIVAATKRVRGYDLATGKELWQCAGLSRNVVSTPIPADGVVYVSNSYDWRVIMAIKLAGAKGDISKTDQVAWYIRKNTSYVPSPLLYDNSLYFLGHLSGVLSRADIKTGEVVEGPYRLEKINRTFASPLGAAKRIYIADQDGTVIVLQHGGAELKTLAINQLDERFSASPVAVGKDLLLRGKSFLYCLAE